MNWTSYALLAQAQLIRFSCLNNLELHWESIFPPCASEPAHACSLGSFVSGDNNVEIVTVMLAKYFQLPDLGTGGRIAFVASLWLGGSLCLVLPMSREWICQLYSQQAHLITASGPSKVLSPCPSEARNIWLLFQPVPKRGIMWGWSSQPTHSGYSVWASTKPFYR